MNITTDLYGRKAKTWPQKFMVLDLAIVFLALSAWILFGSGRFLVSSWFGWTPAEAIPVRYWVIFGFSLITLLRMSVTLFYLFKRAMPWSEAFSIPLAFALYFVGFAVLVLPNQTPLSLIDYFAIVLFVVGSWLNTGGELQRDRFKKRPENKGKLFTSGFFAYSMHVNYFGDILWVAAYALVTGNAWSVLIVLWLIGFFAFFNIPMLDRHLAAHYGQQFEAYRARTSRLIPYVW